MLYLSRLYHTPTKSCVLPLSSWRASKRSSRVFPTPTPGVRDIHRRFCTFIMNWWIHSEARSETLPKVRFWTDQWKRGHIDDRGLSDTAWTACDESCNIPTWSCVKIGDTSRSNMTLRIVMLLECTARIRVGRLDSKIAEKSMYDWLQSSHTSSKKRVRLDTQCSYSLRTTITRQVKTLSDSYCCNIEVNTS